MIVIENQGPARINIMTFPFLSAHPNVIFPSRVDKIEEIHGQGTLLNVPPNVSIVMIVQDAVEKEYPANIQNKPTVSFEIFILHDIQGVIDVNETQEKKHNTTAKGQVNLS